MEKPSTPTADGPTAPKRPTIVLAIVVDQLAAWVAEARLGELPPDGGFARLRREGTWLKEMHFLHAATDTGAGHAALFTGTPPRATGIIANGLVDDAGVPRPIMGDSQARLVAPDGALGVGASAKNLVGDTLADRLRAAVPDAAIVGLALKDRGAIPGCGRKPTACLWYDVLASSFVTSTAFGTAFPVWARAIGSRDALRTRWTGGWDLLDRAWVVSRASTPDDQPGEGNYQGLGTTFPHSVAASLRPADTFRYTPLADEALLELTLAAVEGTAVREKTTFIAVSLSGYDYGGHIFGPDSWEAWDHLRRIDARLARLFAALDGRVGAEGWAALVTSDHGVTPLPETASRSASRPWCAQGQGSDRWQRPCGAGGRLAPQSLVAELRTAAQAAIGDGNWVSGVSEPWVFLTEAGRALPADRRTLLGQAIVRQLMTHPEVERAIDVRSLPTTCGNDQSLETLVCHSHFERHGAGTYIVLKPGAIFESYQVLGRGTNHGTPLLFDRAVPLLVRAPGWVAAARVMEGPLPYTTFTRTAASLLGVSPPGDGPQGADLTQ